WNKASNRSTPRGCNVLKTGGRGIRSQKSGQHKERLSATGECRTGSSAVNRTSYLAKNFIQHGLRNRAAGRQPGFGRLGGGVDTPLGRFAVAFGRIDTVAQLVRQYQYVSVGLYHG